MFNYAIENNCLSNVIQERQFEIADLLLALEGTLHLKHCFIGLTGGREILPLISVEGGQLVEKTSFGLSNASFFDEPLSLVRSQKDYPFIFVKEGVGIASNAGQHIWTTVDDEYSDETAVIVGYVEALTFDKAHICQLVSNFAKTFQLFVKQHQFEKQTRAHLSLMEEVQALSKTGAWEYRLHDGSVYWSDEIYRIHALPIGEPVSAEQVLSFYAAHDQPKITAAFENLINNGEDYDLELKFVDALGVSKWVRTNGHVERDGKGKIIRVFGAFEDITQAKILHLENQRHNLRLTRILDSLSDAVIKIDRRGIILHCNQMAFDMFGYAEQELIGANVSLLMPESYAKNHDGYMTDYHTTGKAKILGTGRQLPAQRKNGETFQMELSLAELHGEEGYFYIGVVRDISERLEAQDTIYNLAFTDNVTELRNSQWFEREAKELAFSAFRQSHCVFALMIDIDNMASFNRRYGFNAGDKALRAIANNLKDVIGRHYALYKYESDAFIILSKKTLPRKSVFDFDVNLIERAVLHADNFKVSVGGHEEALSASLGSAIFDPSEHSFETMLDILEHALKHAKVNAPLGVYHVSTDGIAQYDRLVTIQNKLSTLADCGELSLAFQPQCNELAEICSYEALVRWHSDTLGWVSPADFIPLAEESNAILSIGNWVIHEACRMLTTLSSLNVNCSISINISAKQIIAPNFKRDLFSALQEHDIPTHRIMLELTETTLVSDISLVKRVMKSLANKGIRFSIDDFGTGYSSLAYLKELPISEIKIDKYFVDDIKKNTLDTDYNVVDAIINMASALGAQCVAEGVENEVQRDYLARKGCSLFQGYFFSKPLDVPTLIESLTDNETKTA